ncbi:DsrE family protein [Haladaptatus sp. DJG-WS-42]|uniref:DsrE family protein n=1 Tax=Haladaptatus sp. DJG-WS-42 TaxID=3120516 RepID=UPI0030D1E91A
MNTVFHFSVGGEAAYGTVLSNIENLLADTTVPDRSVVCVTNGDGVFLLRHGEPHADRIATLHERGVSFRVCSNSLKSRSLGAADLHPAAEMVPSGGGELTRLQAAGYAYIKTP